MTGMTAAPAARRPGRWAYALGVVSAAGMVWGRLALGFGPGEPPMLILFLIPIMLTAFVGGLGPGLVATAVAAVGTKYFLVPTLHTFLVQGANGGVQWVALILIGTLVSVQMETLHRARSDGETAAERTQWATEKKVQAGFAFALVSLGVVGVISFRSVTRQEKDAARVTHTHEVIDGLRRLLSTVTDAETAQRGFTITGGEEHLAPYLDAPRQIDADLNALRKLTADNPAQRNRLERLEPLLAERLAALRDVVELRRTSGFPAAQAVVASGRGKELHDRIRAAVAQMEETERTLLEEREATVRTSSMVTRMVIVAGSVLAFAVVGVAVYLIGRDFAGSRRAEAALREAHDDLDRRVRERTAELVAVNASLRSSLKETGELRAALDEHAIVAFTDARGRITSVNDKFCAISQYAREELIGQDHRIINSGYHSKEFMSRLWSTISGGGVWQGDIKNRAKDGSIYWVATTIVPFMGEAGKPRQYVAIRADITGRKRAEEIRRRFTAIVESSNDAIVSKTLDGIVHSWNPGAEKIFGYTEEEMIGQSITRLFPPERLGEEHDIQARLSRGERVEHFETVRVRKDGREIDISVTISPIFDEEGKCVGASKIARDITASKRAEAALRESERRFRALIEQGADSVSVIDGENRIKYLSPAVVRVEGFAPEELVGRNGLERTHPDDLTRVAEYVRQLLAAPGQPVPVLWRRQHKDGRWLWLEGVAVNLLDDPAVGGIVTNYRDITARIAADAEREKLTRLIEHSADFIATADLDGRLTYLNAGGRAMIGFAEHRNAGELHFTDYVPPSWQKMFRDEVITTVRGQGAWDGEMQLRHLETGALVEVSRSTFLIRDPRTGEPWCFATVTRDITERKRAEATLRDSEARSRSVLSALTEGVVFLNPAGVVEMANEAVPHVLGRQLRALEDSAIDPRWQLLRGDGTPLPVAEHPAIVALRTGRPARGVELGVPQPDGSARWLSLNAELVRADSGAVTGVVVSFFNITAEKQAKEKILHLNAELERRVALRTAELEAANQELEAFSYSVSHDLRAPLRGIDGFARIVQEDYADKLDAEGRRLLDIVCHEARRMGQLIDDLLRFSRLGRQHLESADIDMTALVQSVYAELTTAAPATAPRLDLRPLPAARGDRAMLRQVWVNLLGNAVKFTARVAEPTIIVSGAVEGGRNTYAIADNGVGFDDRFSEKLFGVFQRLHSEQEFEGTGVGLALVQRVIHRHGGQVAATGKVGVGATFSFSLPNPNTRPS